MEELDEDFGQTVVLTKRIQGVLRGYPEGTSVLKELLQNADDASATEISFVLDLRTHTSKALVYPRLAEFQGPALLVHNNSVFTEEDFRSIRRIGDSSKQTMKTKVGRFGVGFNSVYHLTDVPSFVSGDCIVFFDPHKRYLSEKGAEGEPGKRIRFTTKEGQQAVAQHPDTFAPYIGTGGCKFSASYKGTLFRFPLRTPHQAETSEVSKTVYTPQMLRDIFESFRQEAPDMMLFLRHIRSISVSVWESGAERPSTLFSLALSALDATTILKRRLLESVPQPLSRTPLSEIMTLRVTLSSSGSGGGSSDTKTWLVAHGLGQGKSMDMALDPQVGKFDLKLVPWGGIAVLLHEFAPKVVGGKAVQGKPFVFLPLTTIPTGLPVHVNGFFEISENRRDLWYGTDMTGGGKVRSDWNVSLLEDVVPEMYAAVLMKISSELPASKAVSTQFYELFPRSIDAMPWKVLALSLYKRIFFCAIVTALDRWVQPKDVWFLGAVDPALSISHDGLVEALCSINFPISNCPHHVPEMFEAAGCDVKMLTPALFRRFVTEDAQIQSALLRLGSRGQEIDKAVVLLKYALSDNCPLEALVGLPIVPKNNSSLHRIRLYSKSIQDPIFICTGDAFVLLQSLPHRIVHKACAEDQPLVDRLSDRTAASKKPGPPVTDVQPLTLAALRDILHDVLPREWLQATGIAQTWSCSSCTFENSIKEHPEKCSVCDTKRSRGSEVPATEPTAGNQGQARALTTWKTLFVGSESAVSWVTAFWSYLRRELDGSGLKPAELVTTLGDVALLPATDGALYPLRSSTPTSLFAPWDELSPALASALQALGCCAVDAEAYKIDRSLLRFCTSVNPCNGHGILCALRSLEAAKPSGRGLEDIFASIDGQVRQVLLQELCKTNDFSSEEIQVLTRIPIIPVYPPCILDRAASAESKTSSGVVQPSITTPTTTTTHTSPPQPPSDSSLCVFVAKATSPLTLYLPPQSFSSELFGSQFVRSDSETEKAFFRRLGVTQMRRADFLLGHVIPGIKDLPPDLRDSMLTMFLRNLAAFCEEVPELPSLLKSTEFVPTLRGHLAAPLHLYDPSIQEIQELIDANDCYPAKEYQNPHILSALTMLGLQTSVNLSSLLNVARGIEALSQSDPSRAVARGQALMSYLDAHYAAFFAPRKERTSSISIRSLFGLGKSSSSEKDKDKDKDRTSTEKVSKDEFFAQLQSIKWIPVLVDPPILGLPWRREKEPSVFCSSARDVRPASAVRLLSASFFILDAQVHTQQLIESLGWTVELPTEIFAKQLVGYSSQLGGSLSAAQRAELVQNIQVAVPMLYQELSRILFADPRGGPNAAALNVMKVYFKDKPWIWIGDRFCAENDVAFKCLIDARPVLNTLPLAYASDFGRFFRSLGVREAFSTRDFGRLLSYYRDLYAVPPSDAVGKTLSTQSLESDTHSQPQSQSTEPAQHQPQDLSASSSARVEVLKPKPLSKEHLEVVVAALQHVADEVASGKEPLDFEVYAPDADGIMAPATSLVYNDSAWAPPAQYQLVHALLSNDVAQKLGAKSLIQHVLDPSLDGGEYEPYGQMESLTSRLKGILEIYPDGPSIFKELVQNADDAGASELVILFSQRQFGRVSLLSEDMADWQGPSLYVYNNAIFSEKDFNSLANLAQSAKLDDVASTGRFGCGWNSVYHFTDLPAIMSGEHLAILDPHRRFLPGAACARKPGIKMRFVGTRLVEQFPDQFAPYVKRFGADMRSAFKGTLFRFPLRTTTTSSKSEIKPGQPYTSADIRSLFEAFKGQISEMTLFLRNMKNISVREEDEAGAVTILYEARVDAVKPLPGTNNIHAVQDFFKAEKGESKEDKALSAGSSLSSKTLSHADFLRRLAASKPSERPHVDLLKTISLSLHPRGDNSDNKGADSAPLVPLTSTQVWLVSSCLDGGECIEMACDPQFARLRLIPQAAVAVPVSGVPELHQGTLFVTLPLPVHVPFPVHIHGLFEISSNRRDLWTGADMTGDGKQRARWNLALKSDTCCMAYLQAIMQARLQTEFSSDLLAYYRLFPAMETPDAWMPLVKSLYARLAEMPVIRFKEEWVSPSQCIFMLPEKESAAQENKRLLDAINALGLKAVCCPRHVTMAFKNLQPSTTTILLPALCRSLIGSPQSEIRVAFEGLLRGSSETDNRREMFWLLLSYLLSDIDAENPSSLKSLDGLAIFPTLENKLQPLYLRSSSLPHETRSPPVQLFYSHSAYPEGILEDAKACLLQPRCMEVARAHLEALGAMPNANIKPLSLPALRSLFVGFVPKAWIVDEKLQRSQGRATVSSNGAWKQERLGGGGKGESWLRSLWTHLRDGTSKGDFTAQTIASTFGEIALLPSTRGDLYPLQSSVPTPLFGPWSCVPVALAHALQAIGCCAVDAEAMGIDPSLLTSCSAINSPDGRGILSALRAREVEEGSLERVFSEAGDDVRLVLLSELCKTSDYNQEDMMLLARLPIIPVHAPGVLQVAVSDEARADFSGENASAALPVGRSDSKPHGFACAEKTKLLFPPLHLFSSKLLGPRFVRPVDESAIPLLRALGVGEISYADFIVDFVFPDLVKLEDSFRARFLLHTFSAIERLASMRPSFVEEIMSVPCVRSRDGHWRLADQVYDPSVTQAGTILPPDECYPHESFAAPEVLETLSHMGVNKSIGCKAVLQAVLSISRLTPSSPTPDGAVVTMRQAPRTGPASGRVGGQEQEQGRAESSASVEANDPTAELSNRAFALVELLDTSLGKFCAEAKRNSGELERLQSALQKEAWFPVMQRALSEKMPWSRLAQAQRFRAPCQLRPRSEAWLVGGSMCVGEIEVSPELSAFLGWTQPPSPLVLAKQLSAFHQRLDEFDDETERRHITDTMIAFVKALSSLAGAEQDDANKAIVKEVTDYLAFFPWVWSGETFVSAAHVAFESDLSQSAAPYLFTVNQLSESWRCSSSFAGQFIHPAFALTKVAEKFDLKTYASVLVRMERNQRARELEAGDSKSSATGPERGKASHLALSVKTSWASERSTSSPLQSMENGGAAVADAVPPSSLDDGKTTPLSREEREVAVAVEVATLLAKSSFPLDPRLPLPTSSGRLVPADQVVFNDSTWTGSHNVMGFFLLHPSLSEDVSRRLGLRSLKDCLNTNSKYSSSLACPSKAEAMSCLSQSKRRADEGGHLPLFDDILDLANELGCSSVRFSLDVQEHDATSVLLPRLSFLQGPALCIVLQDCTLTPTRISELLMPNRVDSALCGSSRPLRSLLSCYALSDVLFVLSGANLSIFDPSSYFLSAEREQKRSEASSEDIDEQILEPGVARTYAFAESAVFVSHMRHQFDPFAAYGFDVGRSRQYPGTIIRLPLRDVVSLRSGLSSPLLDGRGSACSSTIGALQEQFGLYQRVAAAQLASSSCVSAISFVQVTSEAPEQDSSAVNASQPISPDPSHAKGSSVVTTLYLASVASSGDHRLEAERRKIAQTQSWKGKLFSGITDIKTAYEVVLDVIRQDPATNRRVSDQETWIVAQAMGNAASREVSYKKECRHLALKPAVGVAFCIRRHSSFPERDGSLLAHSDGKNRESAGDEPAQREREQQKREARGDSFSRGEGELEDEVEDEGEGEDEGGSEGSAESSARSPQASAAADCCRLLAGCGFSPRIPLPVYVFGMFLVDEDRGVAGILGETESAPAAVWSNGVLNSQRIFLMKMEWNRHLMDSIVIPYAEALSLLSTHPLTQTARRFAFKFWPGAEVLSSTNPWLRQASIELLKKLMTMQLFFLTNGKRASLTDGYYLARAVDKPLRKYVGEHFENCLEIPHHLLKTLQDLDIKAGSVFQRPRLTELTPKVLRNHIRHHLATPAAVQAAAPDPKNRAELAASMLVFAARDLGTAKQDVKREALAGLPILPLSSGVVPVGSCRALIATESERALVSTFVPFAFVDERAVNCFLRNETLLKTLRSMDIIRVDASFLSERVLPAAVAPQFYRAISAPWEDVNPSEDWLLRFWAAVLDVSHSQCTSTDGARDVSSPARAPEAQLERAQRCTLLKDWALIPTTERSLVSVSLREALICVSEDAAIGILGSELLGALAKIHCYIIREEFQPTLECISGTAPPALSETSLWPTYLAHKMGALAGAGIFRSTTALTEDDCVRLFEYFLVHEAELEQSEEVRGALRQVPMFRLMDGGFGALASDACTFDPLICGPSYRPSGRRYISYDTRFLQFYHFLGVEVMQKAKLIEQCVIPNIGKMSPAAVHGVMLEIKNHWGEITQESPSIITRLSSTRCVSNSYGKLCLCSELVDPKGHELLAAAFVHTPDVIPDPDLYADDSWGPFLKDLGVNNSVNLQVLRMCCENVERWPPEDREGLKHAAVQLTRFLVKNPNQFGGDNKRFFDLLKSARVVPISWSQSSFSAGLASSASMSSFHGTPASALGQESHVSDSFQLFRFSDCALKRDMDLAFMVKPILPEEFELSQVFWGKAGIQSPPLPRDVVENLLSVNRNVLEHWPLASSVTDAFARMYTYLMDRWESLEPALQARLKAQGVVPIANTMVPASRLFFRLQGHLGPYLFEIPRVFHAFDKLFVRLGVQEKPTLEGLLETLQALAEEYDGIPLNPSELQGVLRLLRHLREMSAGSRLPSSSSLYVPDDSGVLVPASACVVCDSPWLLSCVDMSRVNRYVVSPILDGEFAAELNLPTLRSLVRPRLLEPCESSDVEQRVFPKSLVSRIESIVIWQQRHMVSEQTIRRVRSLTTFRACTASEIRAAYYFRAENITKVGSATLFFVDEAEKVIWISARRSPSITFEDALCSALSEYLGSQTPLPLATLLRSLPTAGSAEGTVDEEVWSLLGCGNVSSQFRGIPGQQVVEEDIPLLQLHSNRDFFEKEVVAWEKDGQYFYGEILTLDDEEKAKDPLAMESLEKVKVGIGSGRVQYFLPTAIWSFRQNQRSDRSARSKSKPLAPQEDSVAAPPQVSEATSQKQQVSVSTEEYMQAVKDLLRRANMPLSLDVEKLMTENQTLQKHAKASSEALKVAKTELDKMRDEFEELDHSLTCPVCMRGKGDGITPDTALVPCGHVYCSDCVANIGYTCPTCKRAFTSRLQLYR